MARTLTIGETRLDVDGVPAALEALPHVRSARTLDPMTGMILVTSTIAAEQLVVADGLLALAQDTSAAVVAFRARVREAIATTSAIAWEYRTDTLELRPDEIERVIAGIRDGGAEVMIGGSRCHYTYKGRDGQLLVEDFDEGMTNDRPMSDAELRPIIAAEPAPFLEVLRGPHREALRRSLVGASTVSPHEVMRELLEWGECFQDRHLLATVIDWPTTPSPEALRELVAFRDGNDLFHFIRRAIGYGNDTPAAGDFGLRVFEVVGEVLGRELPHWRRYRGGFRANAGDFAGAIEDLQWECDHLPTDDLERTYIERDLGRLVDAKILAEIAAAPDDDGPRLVWADMLTERGDPRGELIVAACRHAKLELGDPDREALLVRMQQLLALHGAAWGKRGYAWHRGFPSTITARWRSIAADFDEAFALVPPIDGLKFRAYSNDQLVDPARALDDPRLDKLTELEFECPYFKVGDVTEHFGGQLVQRMVARFPDLEELTIHGSRLTRAEVELLGPRPKLKKLDLGHTPMHGAIDALVGGGRFAALAELVLSHGSLADDDLPPLAGLRALEDLDLGHNAIGARGASELTRLANLSSLNLGTTTIGDAGASALASLTKLRRLDFGSAGLTDGGVAALSDLELTYLELSNNAITAAALRALASGRIAKTLRQLVVGPFGGGRIRLDPETIAAFAAMPNLWRLLLCDCDLGDDGAVRLLDAIPGLRGLTLGNCAMDDAALARLVAHPGFARLDGLQLDHNRLGPDAGRVLARASRLPLKIYLNANRLGDEGARALVEAPVIAGVAELILLDNRITDDGAHAIAGPTSRLLTTVARLCLHDNAIGDDAAKACVDKLGPRFCHPASPRDNY